MAENAILPRPMGASFVHTSELVMPNDTNPHGTLSGGRLMHWIDLAGAMSAMRHARRMVVTAAIDDVVFHAPIPTGHMVLLDAVVTCVGRTSMEVRVDVRGENPVTGEENEVHIVFPKGGGWSSGRGTGGGARDRRRESAPRARPASPSAAAGSARLLNSIRQQPFTPPPDGRYPCASLY